MNQERILKVLQDVSEILAAAQVSAPIIFGAVAAIAATIRTLTGSPTPSLSQLAADLEAQLQANDQAGKTEIERLKASLGNV